MYFKEFEELGLNFLTGSSLALVLLTIWQMKALRDQGRTIWKKRTGKSISTSWFTFLTFFQIITFYYGLYAHSFTITFTGLTFLFYRRIMLGLWQFKTVTSVDKLIGVASALGVVLVITPIPVEIVYSAFLLGSVVQLAGQTYELVKEKSPGVLNPQVLLVLFVKVSLWVIFALAADERVYKIFAPIYWVMIASTLALWCHYKLKEKRQPIDEQGDTCSEV